MMGFFDRISAERRAEVADIISRGSQARPAFYVLVGLSTLIAAFGLLMNSTAVIIGAMLVAPLMTPILGISMALVRGAPGLLGTSLRSEIAGVAIAVAASTVLGMAMPYFDATPEMLARTQPNLLDLMVAVLAGLAGAYAMVDEKVSPVLPGVAISTAIVPPLANAGLSLSIGAFQGAWGSFLLFFTNFLSILLASALVFYASGMAETLALRRTATVARRFGLAVVGFLVVGVILGGELAEMIRYRQREHSIRRVLEQELSPLRIVDLEKLAHQEDRDGISVLAHVHAPSVITPSHLQTVEGRLAEELGVPTELTLRTTLTRDVAALGSATRTVVESLDGLDFERVRDPNLDLLEGAEQVIREYLGERLGMDLEDVMLMPYWSGSAVVAEIAGLRALWNSEVAELEGLIRERLDAENIHLFVREETVGVRDPSGALRTDLLLPRPTTREEETAIDTIQAYVQTTLAGAGFHVFSWSVTRLDRTYYALFEVTGPRLFTPDEVRGMTPELDRAAGAPVELFVRSLPEAVVSANGHTTLDRLLPEMGERVRGAYGEGLRSLVENWR